MPHILVAGPLHSSGLALLEAAQDFTYHCVDETSEEAYRPFIAKADGMVIRTQPMSANTISLAPHLRIVSRHGVGYDAVDAAALAARDIPLCVVGDVNSGSVAEQTIALIFALLKQVQQADRAVRNGDWPWRNQLSVRELNGRNLLILGYGRIGQRLSKLLSGFDLQMAAYDPYLAAHGWPEGPVRQMDDLQTALAWADIVTVHMPKTDAPLIGSDELSAMQPHALLINTARGGIIDERALCGALDHGEIAGAGLDVFANEPPSEFDTLLQKENVVLSPHLAGLTQEGAERLAVTSVQHVLDYFAGRLDRSFIVNGVQPYA